MNQASQDIATIADIMRPVVELIITVFGPILVTWLAAKLAVMLDLKNEDQKVAIEQKVRFALHEAAENALAFAMAKFGFKLGSNNLSESLSHMARSAALGEENAIRKIEDVVHSAVEEYLKPKMPDAINKLGASDTDLADIVLAKIPKV